MVYTLDGLNKWGLKSPDRYPVRSKSNKTKIKILGI